MKPIAFTAIAALLGACSTATTTPPAPTVASIGTALYSGVGGGNLTVTQNGTHHVLPTAPGLTHITHNGITIANWASGGTSPSGSGVSSIDHTYAAGLDNGTYFAGISRAPSATLPSTGVAALSGLYAFVVNGVDKSGPLVLTADFSSGTVTDSTTGITVNGIIWGAGLTGTVDIGGETSALKGGFYHRIVNATYPHGYVLDGVALGSNMAGVIAVK